MQPQTPEHLKLQQKQSHGTRLQQPVHNGTNVKHVYFVNDIPGVHNQAQASQLGHYSPQFSNYIPNKGDDVAEHVAKIGSSPRTSRTARVALSVLPLTAAAPEELCTFTSPNPPRASDQVSSPSVF